MTTPPPASGSDDANDGKRSGRVRVGLGEFEVVTDGQLLTTSGLGSCVAIALHDPTTGVRGLLHAMLPSADSVATPAPRPAKYVDTGVDRLVESMDVAGCGPERLRGWIVGGAEMLEVTDAVGPRNVDAAHSALEDRRVELVGSDVGSDVGRTVSFTPDGRIAVRAADGFERRL